MTTEEDARSFLLGTFVDHSGVPFPAIVIADFAYPIRICCEVRITRRQEPR